MTSNARLIAMAFLDDLNENLRSMRRYASLPAGSFKAAYHEGAANQCMEALYTLGYGPRYDWDTNLYVVDWEDWEEEFA